MPLFEDLIQTAVILGVQYYSNDILAGIHSALGQLERMAIGSTREFIQDPKSMLKKLIIEARNNETGCSVSSLGYLGGNYAVISPRSHSQLVELLNKFDEEKSGRKSHASFKYFSGNDFFIISDVGHNATSLRKNLSRFLSPSKLFQPMVQEIETAVGNETEIQLRHKVCGIVRTVLLDNILGITELPENTYDLMEAYRNDVKRWGAFPFPELMNYIPSLRKKRETYQKFSKDILEGEFDKIVEVLHTSINPENANLIASVIVNLFKEENPDLDEIEQNTAIKSMPIEQIRRYFEHPVVQTLPMILKAADNLTDAIVLCLEKLAEDPNKLHMLRKELKDADLDLENAEDIMRLKALPIMSAFYKESIRFDAPSVVPRYTTTGYQSESLTIPPNTMVIFDLESLTRGDEYWSNPNDFDPNRFLADSEANAHELGKKNIHTVGQFPFVPFSVGRRNCPAFAITEVLFKAAVAKFALDYQLKFVAKTDNDTVLNVSRHKPDKTATQHVTENVKRNLFGK